MLKQPICVNYPLPLCWVSHRMELTARNAEFMPCPSVGFGHLLVFLGFYVSDEGDNEFLLSVECFDGNYIAELSVQCHGWSAVFKDKAVSPALISVALEQKAEVACVAEYNFLFYFFFL